MKTFDYGEYGMIDALDSDSDSSVDCHGVYVLLNDALKIEQQRDELLAALKEIQGCFNAAKIEGLDSALSQTNDVELKDLIDRRLMHALYAAQKAIEANQ